MPSDPRRGLPSASSAAADFLCPGRHLAQRGLADAESSAAAFGNAVHAALAGQTDAEALTSEQRRVFDGAQAVERAVLSDWASLLGVPVDSLPEPKRELRLWAFDPELHPTNSGQVDVLWRYGDRGLILDYKSLYGAVAESPHNLQLRDLAVLAADNFDLAEVCVAIVQPMVRDRAALTRYDLEALRQADTEMRARVARSMDAASSRCPGAIQCQWCRAKTRCPEALALVADTANMGLAPAIAGAVAQLSPAALAGYLDRLPVVEAVAEALRREARGRLQSDPDALAGRYVLRPNAPREKIVLPRVVFERFLRLGGTEIGFLECVSLGKGALEDLVRLLTGRRGEKLDAAMAELLAGATEPQPVAPSLVKGPDSAA